MSQQPASSSSPAPLAPLPGHSAKCSRRRWPPSAPAPRLVPRVGVVLGSGLGRFADAFGPVKIPYGDLPHMSSSGVAGHAGNFCFGTTSGVPVVCMQGRVHATRGTDRLRWSTAMPTMARLGALRPAHQRCRLASDPAMESRAISMAHRRPPEPHRRSSAARRPERRRPRPSFPGHDRRVRPRDPGQLHVVADAAEIDAPRGRLRGHDGTVSTRRPPRCRMLRRLRRARGGDEHRPRGHRAPPHGRARRRALLHHQPRRGDHAQRAQSQGGGGRRAPAGRICSRSWGAGSRAGAPAVPR